MAVAENNVIGSKNRIPWLLRADLVKLKNLTLHKIVILGRKTYESMVWYYNKSGREMPGKTYIVVTAQLDYKPAKLKAVVAHSVSQALQKAKMLSSEGKEIFIIGGAAIFEETLPIVDKLYITKVHAVIKGDSFFPSVPLDEWQEIARESHKKDDKNQFDYAFVTLVRRKSIE